MQGDNHDLQAQHRFESFKLGNPRSTHSHARSHSRNTSMSSFTFGASKSTPANMNDAAPPSTKRNSHHKRRSSVSTRNESAEMMGVSVPELPQSKSEDNINLGDKDSIRRRALWALEGKPDASYSKVEIPELMSPDGDGFDFSSFAGTPSVLSVPGPNKRDSFKLLGGSSSAKDQLHTLVEEDEDEEETVPSPQVPAPKPLTSKPRPSTLSLRPLSLTPDGLGNSPFGLPTPPTSSRPRSGLRSLSLVSEARSSQTPSPPMGAPPRRPTLNLQIASDGSLVKTVEKPTESDAPRRSSISYKRTSTGLPTPEMTPTFDNRRSISSVATDDDDNFSVSSSSSSFSFRAQARPLSTSEQHFLFKSHNSLLARIMDLERSLSSRQGYGSRPSSALSDVSNSSSAGEDEMIRLVADLKGERDELKRDVEGWRERVSDMDKQLVTLSKRVDNERKDAWVARTKCGMFETERDGLAKEVASLNSQIDSLKEETQDLRSQVSQLDEEKAALEREVARLKAAQDTTATSTPTNWQAFSRKRNLDFGDSLDSASSASTTDVEIDESPLEFGFSLKTVTEESEDGYFSDDNGLAGYEDEDEDIDITTSSISDEEDFGPDYGFPRSVVVLKESSSQEVSTGLATPKKTPPSHQSRASLSKTWTFPRGPHPTQQAEQDTSSDVDRFFGCLDDKEDSPILSQSDDEDPYSFERSKGLFARGFKYAADTDMPAWLFGGAASQAETGLGAIQEDDEDEGSVSTKVGIDEDDVFCDVGGIKITFTPPSDDNLNLDFMTPKPVAVVPSSAPESPSPTMRSEPLSGFDIDDEEDEDITRTPFNFSRPTVTQTITPPSSNTRRDSSHSGIPRAISRSSPSDSPTFGFMTPPNKRSSFIPQPVSPKPKITTTFIRQPTRKSMLPSPKASNVDGKMNAISRFSDDLPNNGGGGGAVMTSIDMGNRTIEAHDSPKSPPVSAWSSPLSKFSTSFSSFIPMPWSPKVEEVGVVLSSPLVVEKKRGFVSKERQLEKLRIRLQTEGAAIIPFAGDVCKRCHEDDAVFL